MTVQLTAEVVAAYLKNNHISQIEIAPLIAAVHRALEGLGQSEPEQVAAETSQSTPAQIRRSIRPKGLVSFEDGKLYKTLRRHLTALGLTPDGYREKWGLPYNYPMVSADYSAKRSQLAKASGLGNKAVKPKTSTKSRT